MISEKLKAIKSQNSLQETIHIKAKYQKHESQIAKSSSPSVRWKVNSSLTQKDTTDRGAWINSERKEDGGLKRTKVQMAQKCSWHGNEEQRQ